ncbi:MAG: DUF5011 domain-containing protein [Chitinophagales bacterium]
MFRFLLTTVLLGLSITIQAQQSTPILQQFSPKRSIIKHTNPSNHQSVSGNEIGMPVNKPSENGLKPFAPLQKAAGVRLGGTTYDLQTNTGMCRRVAVDGDKVYATWTMSQTFDLTASDRGTGFNESSDNGSSWAAEPTERLEKNTRVGWPNIGVTESGRVFVVTHAAIPNQTAGAGGLAFTWRDGNGPWNTKIIEGDVDATWARVGNSGKDIHVITSRSQLTGINGINGELHYFRSFDEGETWSQVMTFPDMENYLPQEGITADSYFMDARGDVVAFAVGRYGAQTFLYKSMDKGDTWNVTIINSTSSPNMSVVNPDTGEFDPAVVSDGHIALLIDNNDKVHVWYDRLFNIESGGGISYLPNSNCLMYWNDEMDTNEGRILGKTVRMDYDGDCQTGVDFVDGTDGNDINIETQSYGNSLVGHPSAGIDAEGNLYLAFSSVRDGAAETLRPKERIYRDIYLIKSTDGGQTWEGPFNATDDPASEDVYPSIQRNVGSHVHLVYQRDAFTGTAVDNASSTTGVLVGQDDFVVNEINYIKIAVEDIQTPNDLNNTCPNYFPFVNGTVPNAIEGCTPPIETLDTHVFDFPDGDLTQDVEVRSTFDVNVPGDMGLWVLYVADSNGNEIEDTILLANDGQTQVFEDTFSPAIIGQPYILLGAEDLEDAFVNFDPNEVILSLFPAFDTVDVVVNTPYLELGVGVFDDGELFGCPPNSGINGFVNTSMVTTEPFEIIYSATDRAGNETVLSRWVNVIGADLTSPTILLTIDDPFNPTDEDGVVVVTEVQIGETWVDPGFIAFDNVDGLITDEVVVTGEVNLEVIGNYTVVYMVTDNAGNSTQITRIVEVRDTTEPTVSIIGPVPVVTPCGGTYNEFGANAFDDIDGSLTNQVVTQVFDSEGKELVEVCTEQAGSYVVRYSVADASGNVGFAERLVIVQGTCTSDSCEYVGIGDHLFDSDITIYPNPAKNQFIVNFQDLINLQTQIGVYNIVGELVYESRQTIGSNPLLQIDLANVAAGIYFVKIQTPEGSLTKKLVIRD